ncbi:MAG: glycoside hydrolase family 25 protein [Clostridiales bacterium]|nr:glycoside hydrolase family 25 protein [Clostridiales bacterium]
MEDTNKREETFRQIDAQIPKKMEFGNPVEAMEKELNDTKAYLDIVLKELEEAKTAEPIKKIPKRNLWKRIALLETVLVLSGCVVFAIYSKNEDSLPTMKAQEEVQENHVVDHTVIPEIKTKKLCQDLTAFAKEFTMETSEFTPSVVTLFGYEYLMFSNGKIHVYYRNEIPADTEQYRQKIMIDNGTRISEFVWDYDFDHGIDSLCPKIGNYFGTGELQLVFPIYEEQFSKTMPKQIRAVSVVNLWEHDYLDLESELNTLFAAEFQEIKNGSNGVDRRMKLSLNSTSYTYAIEEDEYMNAVYYEENIVAQEKYFKLEFEEDSIKISTIPYLSDHKYLGEFSATVGLNNNELKLKNVSFGAYVKANQEDPELEGVITPRADILSEDRIKLWGKRGEVYFIELSDILERNLVKQEDLKKDKSGFITYQKGDTTSIPGIDVSKFQGEIDWKKVKNSGVEFVMIRLGFRGFNEGTLEIDPYFEKNIQGAIENDINVGIYFFSQAITIEEAKEEAAFVLENLKDYKITYPVVFDTEFVSTYAARANILQRQLRTDITKAFCEEMKANGYKPMIYANTKWMIMGIDLEQLTDYDVWFAYYGDNLTFPYKFDMLQYSEKGRVDGIDSYVDLNFSLKDYSKEQENKTKGAVKKQ